MLFTRHDPRSTWRQLADQATLTAADEDTLRALPAGAKEAVVEWVCDLKVEQRGHFDKDRQEEVAVPFTTATAWRKALDPRVGRAGALSFHGIDSVGVGFFATMPKLGPAMRALTVEGHQLSPTSLKSIAAAADWEDVQVWGSRWSTPSRKAGLRELAAFTRLKGLELQAADLDADDLAALKVDGLEDLAITGRMLNAQAFLGLADRLDALVHLDLRDARLGPKAARALAPKLTRARRISLTPNPIGDEGLRALAESLGAVEDLWLSGCDLTDASARVLAATPMPKLRGLWLDSNRLTDAGIQAVMKAPWFGSLEGLSLYQRGLGAGLMDGHPLAGAISGTARLPGVTALWFLGR